MFDWLRRAFNHNRDPGRMSREDVIGSIVTYADVAGQGWAAKGEARELLKYAGCVWVAICVERNAEAVANTPLRLYRKRKAGSTMSGKSVTRKSLGDMLRSPSLAISTRKKLETANDLELVDDPEHPVNVLLSSAWPGGSGWDLLGFMEGFRSLAGSGFAAIVTGSNGYPIELWPVSPSFVRVMQSRETLVDHYMVGPTVAEEIRYEPSEILHLKGFNWAGNLSLGMGDLAKVFREADIVASMSGFAKNAFDNAVFPGMAMWVKNATDDQRKAIEAKLNSRKGAWQALKTMILGGLEEPKALPWGYQGPEKITGILDDSFLRDKIANAFDTPISLLTQDTAALAQAKVAMSQWQQLAIAPRCQRIEDRLNESLMPLFWEPLNDDSLVLAFDNPVKADPDELITRCVTASGGPVLTVNEVRETYLNLPPIDGGDVLRQDPSAPPPSGGLFGDGDGADVEDEEDAKEDKRLPKARGAVKRYTDDWWSAPGPDKCCAHHPRSKLVRKDDRREVVIQATQDQLERQVAKWFDALSPIVDDTVNYDTGTAPGLRNRLTSPDVVDRFVAATDGPFSKLFVEGWNGGIDKLRGQVGNAAPIDTLTPSVAQMMRGYQTRLAKTAAGSLADRVTETLARSIEDKQPMPERVEAISSIMGEGTQYAAERIARTESLRSYTESSISAWKEAGTVVGFRWLLSGDPCPVCIALSEVSKVNDLNSPMVKQGQTIPGTETIHDYDDINGPPGHVNCRCEAVPVFAWEVE